MHSIGICHGKNAPSTEYIRKHRVQSTRCIVCSLTSVVRRERANDAYFEFGKSSHLQPLAPSSHLQPLAATCSHLVQFPLAAFPRRICNILRRKTPENSQHSPVGASGCKCLLGASGCEWLLKWLLKWLQVAASGCSWLQWLQVAAGSKRLQVAASGCSSGCKWLQVAASGCKGAFWKQISAILRPLGQLLNFSSGIIGKRPFLAKSWPGAFWKQISAIWWLLGASGCKWLQVAAGSK